MGRNYTGSTGFAVLRCQELMAKKKEQQHSPVFINVYKDQLTLVIFFRLWPTMSKLLITTKERSQQGYHMFIITIYTHSVY